MQGKLEAAAKQVNAKLEHGVYRPQRREQGTTTRDQSCIRRGVIIHQRGGARTKNKRTNP